MGIRASISVILAAGLLAAAPVFAQDQTQGSVRVLTFLNRTCGPVTIAIRSEDPCAGFSPACEFTVDPGSTYDLSLDSADFTPYFNTTIEGRCAEVPPAVIYGACEFDANRLFPPSAVTVEEGPPPGLGMDLYDTLDMYDPYESLFGTSTPVPKQYGPVQITVDLSECDLSPNGQYRQCGVTCQRLTY